MLLKIIEAIIAIPKIAGIVEKLLSTILALFEKYQSEQAKKKIEEAKIATEKAKTKEDRREAAKKWHDAISG